MQGPGGPAEDPSGGFTHGGWSVNYWDDVRLDDPALGRARDSYLEVFTDLAPHAELVQALELACRVGKVACWTVPPTRAWRTRRGQRCTLDTARRAGLTSLAMGEKVMMARPTDQVVVLAFDIFGTTVDWRAGVAAQVAEIAAERGVQLDAGAFADEWRDRYLPSVDRVRSGEREWVNLDILHRESLDQLLELHGLDDAFDEPARRRLVVAWHRLPAWDDAIAGLTRLRTRYVLAALSNGGFALLTRLIKTAGLPFDCILSAELARTYKPDPRVYRTATDLLDVDPAQVMMVAAHGWDIAGAREAGLRTAFLERPAEKGPDRVADQAVEGRSDLAVAGFTELAETMGC